MNTQIAINTGELARQSYLYLAPFMGRSRDFNDIEWKVKESKIAPLVQLWEILLPVFLQEEAFMSQFLAQPENESAGTEFVAIVKEWLQLHPDQKNAIADIIEVLQAGVYVGGTALEKSALKINGTSVEPAQGDSQGLDTSRLNRFFVRILDDFNRKYKKGSNS